MDKETNGNNELLPLLYFQIVDLWKKLCEEHTSLLDHTCDEYTALLASNIEELDKIVKEKNTVIRRISRLEKLRNNLIDEINKTIEYETPINNVSDLLIIMQRFEANQEQNHLFRFNKVLIDIIEKIQEQNKKNQVFLNRAILSLQEIRESAMGRKSFSTYSSTGKSVKGTKQTYTTK